MSGAKQCKSSGLPLGLELMGAIREYAVHEKRECGCRVLVDTDRSLADCACHISGTTEREEQIRRAEHMRAVAANARYARRQSA
jgi:hypothetical protein